MARAYPVFLLLSVSLLSGCVVSEGGDVVDCSDFETGPDVYRYRYPGDDVSVSGGTYGWMVRLENPYNEYMLVHLDVDMPGVVEGLRIVDVGNGERHVQAAEQHGTFVFLHGHASALLVFTTRLPSDLPPGNVTMSFGMESSLWLEKENRTVWDTDMGYCAIRVDAVDQWDVTLAADATPVRPGDMVQTYTVGVWTNGTSFYTNIAALNEDPGFPAGYDRTEFDGAPLGVYVYGEHASEQPVGNRDRCYATTISGYNALLQTQHERGTNVRYLQPEEAYTVAGAEEHFLYGEPLIFLNTVVRHDGTTTQQDEAPDPTGACFDHRNVCRKEPDLNAPCRALVPPPPVPRAER